MIQLQRCINGLTGSRSFPSGDFIVPIGDNSLSMITGTQIRSARNALRWTTEELAKRSGVTARTIKRFEAVDNVPPSRSSTLLDVKAALEAAGTKLMGPPADRPGIRFAATPARATSRRRRPPR